MAPAISPAHVRYIKLGRHGGWEEECLHNGIIRLGFGTEGAARFDLCKKGKWKLLERSFLREGNDASRASRFANEIRHFFTDPGTTLWITFHGERMYWGFLEAGRPKLHRDGVGTWRTVSKGWRSDDVHGVVLSKSRLGKNLTKLAGYPGTSCNVGVASYVIRRINGGAGEDDGKATSAVQASVFPDEVIDGETYPDGAVCRVVVNGYERNPKARRKCVAHHGRRCSICGFDFEQVYGTVAEGLIHVHHLRELSQIGAEYEVDPMKDLRPVCPNCHAVLHRRKPAFSIEDVKKFRRAAARKALVADGRG
jgi:hypothetical protein